MILAHMRRASRNRLIAGAGFLLIGVGLLVSLAVSGDVEALVFALPGVLMLMGAGMLWSGFSLRKNPRQQSTWRNLERHGEPEALIDVIEAELADEQCQRFGGGTVHVELPPIWISEHWLVVEQRGQLDFMKLEDIALKKSEDRSVHIEFTPFVSRQSTTELRDTSGHCIVLSTTTKQLRPVNLGLKKALRRLGRLAPAVPKAKSKAKGKSEAKSKPAPKGKS